MSYGLVHYEYHFPQNEQLLSSIYGKRSMMKSLSCLMTKLLLNGSPMNEPVLSTTAVFLPILTARLQPLQLLTTSPS